MFITKKHVSRRTFLRGTGVTLALPLLDAMVPAATLLAQTAATPKPRFVAAFVPHGMAPGYWVPDKTGGGFKMYRGVRDKDPAAPYQDLFWALLNSNEFILNH